MEPLELVVWSASLGAIAAVVVARLTDLAYHPGAAAAQAVGYHLTVLLFVALLSGVVEHTMTPDPRALRAAQVLVGPVLIGLSNFWIRDWLKASQRDRLMAGALGVSAIATPLAGIACLALPGDLQLPAAGLLCLANGGLTMALAARAWMLGDRLAPVMAIGCMLTLPAIGGLYLLAARSGDIGPGWQVLLAIAASLCNAQTGFVLWRRARHERRVRRSDARPSQIDPVTRLASGTAVVQRLVEALRRRRRTRRDAAVLAILVFDLERVAEVAGPTGAHELLITLAARIQRQAGVVNPVGRYYEGCFVVTLEALHSAAALRTTALRIAASLRQSLDVPTRDGGSVPVRPDYGVGVVHLSRRRLYVDVDDVLHDAQEMAQAARSMRFRCAIADAASGDAVPMEQASLVAPRRVLPQRNRMPQRRPAHA